MGFIANSRLGFESCDVVPEEQKIRRYYSLKVLSKDITYGLGIFSLCLYSIVALDDV